MAIVFVSPKKRQRIFIAAVAAALVFVLAVIVFTTFIPEITKKFGDIPVNGSKNVPEIKINFEVVDSDAVANLEPTRAIAKELPYSAKDSKGKQITGVISADSEIAAKKLLEERGFVDIVISKIKTGRSNPFAP